MILVKTVINLTVMINYHYLDVNGKNWLCELEIISTVSHSKNYFQNFFWDQAHFHFLIIQTHKTWGYVVLEQHTEHFSK